MKKKCPNCHLVNFSSFERCRRCETDLIEIPLVEVATNRAPFYRGRLFMSVTSIVGATLFGLFVFYASLLLSADKLPYEQRQAIDRSIRILEDKGFSSDVALLRYVTAFRANDNWLNASTRDENAYAATNFPFEIMTIYPDFFTYPKDDVERAAILLHEAQHLKGADEKEAYEFVWRNRKKLGWTKETYGNSVVWRNVRRQTVEFAPNIFICDGTELNDCTE